MRGGGTSWHLLLAPLAALRLLTAGWPLVQEVGCHFPFTFDLDHAAALQDVAFVCEHLVEVRRHLWAKNQRHLPGVFSHASACG